MLFLPLEEDSLLFRLCLYYGALVLLLELLVPLLLQRRLLIEIPRLALRAPAVPLSAREFQQRRLALKHQVASLQRALAETPPYSPQKRRQLSGGSGAEQRSAAAPLPSSFSLASPTSSVKVTRPKSSRKSSEIKGRINRKRGLGDDRDESSRRGEEAESTRQTPMAMSDSLATRTARRGGFSFDEVSEEEKYEENNGGSQQKQEHWTQASDTRAAKRRESTTFLRRKPVRLVDDPESVEYSGASEAATKLDALIEARRRRKATTSTSYMPPPPPVTAPALAFAPVPAPVPVIPAIGSTKPSKYFISQTSKPTQQEIPSPLGQQHEFKVIDEDEETKESERSEPPADFQAFCASFAIGGSAAALQATAKRKHHEAFRSDDEQTNGCARVPQQSEEKRKHPRLFRQDIKPQNDSVATATPQSLDKRSHYEAFGSDDEKEIDDAIAAQQVSEFGTTREEQPQEKTPRIVRRISFGDEVDVLAASPPKEVSGERSTGKRKHKQAFGMVHVDDEVEDTKWRDSLAFRPHRFG